MELVYKTRAMSDPERKPRVYFTCHPEDFDAIFPVLTDDILRYSNCTIWYDLDRSAAPKEKELSLMLDEMQLVVIGVTYRFLHKDNRAKNVEFPMAIEKHIPVLPILMENDIFTEFNEECSGIQAVSKYKIDPTERPYDEVLESFLKSVLIGEELAQKVRDAFDAYVFLSYRKKDRRHALRLMRMIHENVEFRNVAIWYDEFLVPGEKFSNAIAEAMQKSGLFAMAVTPSLTEENNYVMEKEYPAARDRKNRDSNYGIVPVELYQKEDSEDGKEWRIDQSKLIDRDEFKYKKIEDLQDEHRRPEMDKAFKDALDRMAKKENDGSMKHRFFIGLAYLCGIDCEVNYEIALRLIKEAATGEVAEDTKIFEKLIEDDADRDIGKKEPCVEAIAKLAEMYKNGEGVAVDLAESARWQNILADQYLSMYEKNHDPDEHKGYGTLYFKALRKLTDLQKEAKQPKKAMETARKALDFCRFLDAEVGVREQEHDRAVVLNILGSLYQKDKNYAAAEECYAEACAIYEQLAWQIGSSRARRDLSISYERLGDLNRKKGDPDAAHEYYKKALALREDLYMEETSPQSRRDLSSVLTKLGNVHKSGKAYSKARYYYESALAMDEQLMEETLSAQAKDDYGVSLTKVGDICKAEGRFAEAADLYEKAREIFDENYRKTSGLSFLDHYISGCEKLASARKKTGEKAAAEALYRESVELRRKLYEETGTESARRSYGLACHNAALFLKDEELMKIAKKILG